MTSRLRLEPSRRQQPCDLCHRSEFEVVDRLDRKREWLTTVICRHCGLVSHEDIPNETALDDYYRVQYRQDYHGEVSPAPHRVLRAWKGAEWLFKKLAHHVPKGSRVCEIGAGIGCTVKLFELAGYDAEGIEPGTGFQEFAETQLQARIERCKLDDLPPRQTYDFILLVHVIEHFNSPRQALTKIRSLLNDNGCLYVECPNLGAPHAAPGKQFHFAHIHNFTSDTLESLANACGYEIVARLAKPRARAIRFILRRADAVRAVSFPGSYERTRDALSRHTPISYHMRPSYVIDRLNRDLRFVSHHLVARQRLDRILERCQQRAAAAGRPLVTAE